MRFNFIRTEHWARLTKKEARKLYDAGCYDTIGFLPCRMNPENMWMSPCICKDGNKTFEQMCNEVSYYHCCYELGYYLSYYRLIKEMK